MTSPVNKHHAAPPTYTCESLSTLCIDTVTKDFSKHSQKLRYLPNTLKSKLFQIACRRKEVLENVDLLSSLLHSGIKEIDLTNCELTLEMLEKVSHCHNVIKLYMICNSSITREAMINVISGMASLRVLRAKKCPGIDNDFIEALVKHCKLLKILDIAKSKITEEALKDLGQLRLTALDISSVIISKRGMDYLLAGPCKYSLRELIVCCSRSYNGIEDDCPNLTIFVNKINSPFCRTYKSEKDCNILNRTKSDEEFFFSLC